MRKKTIRAGPDFENSSADLASQSAAPDLKFQREDWTSFRTVEGLQQKAGVPASKLRRLVLKELTDNALDAGAEVFIDETKTGYYVEDDGPGLDGTPDQIAHLFSIKRPLISTKLLRLPTRGALGNGLRVVSGSVLASGGSLSVTTKNRRIELRPERDGGTTVVKVTKVKFPKGTRIDISFGPAIPEDVHAQYWAVTAIAMNEGQTYAGKSSPFWYDTSQFHELLSASGATPVRELIANLDGCTGARAGEIVLEAGLGRMLCSDVTRKQTEKLLRVARDNARQVNPKRLGAIGPEKLPGFAYALSSDTISFGSEPRAEIPFVVEAWVRTSPAMWLNVCVNRTPVTGSMYARRDKRDVDIFGCGLHHPVAQAKKNVNLTIHLNITTPYMPITSDGKEPNLEPFLDKIEAVMAKAVRKACVLGSSGSGNRSQKEIVLENLDEVIAEVSGDEGYRFNERQLFYQLRPIVMREIGEELMSANFKNIITDYESENGEIPKMYREPRGSITHPHRDETITLGTLMVEEYERPVWTFNKILYIEKEGANEALKEMRWGERHDCAVISSKGFSTRAARDLIDKLAEHDEPIEVFAAHDADGYGTLIYQTLQEATKARGARKIKIINIGLEPWEAVEMGLEVENVKEREGDRRKPVADYVRERDDDVDWEEWLQTHRVELNAMTTPQLVEWLDAKMAEHGSGKLIPPPTVLEAELAKALEDQVRADLTEKILREAGLDREVADAIAAIKTPKASTLKTGIKQLFKLELDREWRDHIKAVVIKIWKDEA